MKEKTYHINIGGNLEPVTAQQLVHLECARRGRVWGQREPVQEIPQLAPEQINGAHANIGNDELRALGNGGFVHRRHINVSYLHEYDG